MTVQLKYKKIKETKPTEKQGFIWNMLGSGLYSASSMILSLAVINLAGAEQGGIFSIALTLSQMLVYIAYFETRTYQITDSGDEFLFSEYHATKIFTCGTMLLVTVLYILIKGYTIEKAWIVFLVCFSRLMDGYADVYESQFQKDGRLDLAGKSLAYRTILFTGTLLCFLAVTGNLVRSLIIADIVAIIGVWICDVRVMRILREIKPVFHMDKIHRIIKACFPLFVGMFCWTYILSASRIAIDGNMSSEYQAYYQVIFMPVSVINLFAGFILRPSLPKLAEYYSWGKNKEFWMIILKIILSEAAITVICMLGAYLVGIPVLSFFSGCDLSPYRGILVFLIFAGGFNALACTMYYLLTIMRKMNSVLVCYILAAVLAACISSPMVVQAGISGAAWSYFIVVVVLCLLFSLAILKEMFADKQNQKG